MKYLKSISEQHQEPRLPLAVGTLVDRWMLDSVLGQGAEGTTYLAQMYPPNQLSHRAVVKVSNKPNESEESKSKSFLSEAQVLAGLSHPYLPALIGNGTHAGFDWFALT